MTIPQNAKDLRQYLAECSSRFSKAIHEAETAVERKSLAERDQVIAQFLAAIQQQSTRLAQLGQQSAGREAEALVRALRSEQKRIKEDLRRLVDAGSTKLGPDTAIAVGSSLLPSTHESTGPDCPAEDEASVQMQPNVVVTGPVVEDSNYPAPPPTFPTDAGATCDNLAVRCAKWGKEVRDLYNGASLLDEVELECRVNILCAVGRVFQDEALQSANNEEERALHQVFGQLTRICTELLVPKGYWVDAVARKFQTDWQEHQEIWNARLQKWLAERAERERKAVEAETARKRREQVVAENDRIQHELQIELGELVSEPEPDSEYLVGLVSEILHFRSSNEPLDEGLVTQLAPLAHHFKSGSEFRPLRKALRKIGALAQESGRHAAVGDVEVASEPRPSARPTDEFNGRFGGRTGVVVGGSRREYRREKLQKYFGFSELEWIENERTETADGASIGKRIRNGRYGIVLLLARFCSHGLQDHLKSACKAANVPFALVEKGYGQPRISAALRALGSRLPPKSI